MISLHFKHLDPKEPGLTHVLVSRKWFIRSSLKPRGCQHLMDLRTLHGLAWLAGLGRKGFSQGDASGSLRVAYNFNKVSLKVTLRVLSGYGLSK